IQALPLSKAASLASPKRCKRRAGRHPCDHGRQICLCHKFPLAPRAKVPILRASTHDARAHGPWWSSNDGTRPFWIHRPRLAGTREGAVYDCWPEGASVPASAHSIHRSGDGAGRARLARPCLSHAERPGEPAVEYIAAPLEAPTPADIDAPGLLAVDRYKLPNPAPAAKRDRRLAMTQRIFRFLADEHPDTPCLVVDL